MKIGDYAFIPDAGEHIFWRNLTVFPLRLNDVFNGEFITLNEGLSKNEVKVEELPQARVNSVRVLNSSPSHLFILDGEEIYGALQNRVFNTTVILDPLSEEVVPVSCIEEGRWAGTRTFSSSTSTSNPTVRAILNSSVTRNLITTNRFLSDQSSVWDSVRRTLNMTNVSSQTQSLSSAFIAMKDRLREFVSECEVLKNYNGFLISAGSLIVGMDLFYSRSLFLKFFDKLLESYALEGIMRSRNQEGSITKRKVSSFLEKVRVTGSKKFKGIGRAEEIRTVEGDITSKLTLFNGQPLHISAFPLLH